MKEQHANSGQVFYADYVVPVYNLNKDAHYLTTYSNGNMNVDFMGGSGHPRQRNGINAKLYAACISESR